ncbi:hypothetical protein FACS1894211_06590 [Clostridia bacterium]|nr:hypothetical protein FACS1894211_06590 [Clostridia bacterium]
MYLEGSGRQAIANKLTDMGVQTRTGQTVWSSRTISSILQNERYIGNSLLQKTVKINGKVVRNKGQRAMYYVENSHPAIISAEIFEKAKAMIAEKINPNAKYPSEYPDYAFRSKIFCGKCNAPFGHRINSPNTKYAKPIWRCNTAHSRGKKGCDNKNIFNEAIEPLFVTAYNEFVNNKGYSDGGENIIETKQALLQEERNLRALKVRGLIAESDFNIEMAAILKRIEEVDGILKKSALHDTHGKAAKPITEFDGDKVREYLDRAAVTDGTVTFEFINGYKITLPYSNGQSGNRKGWKEKLNKEVTKK